MPTQGGHLLHHDDAILDQFVAAIAAGMGVDTAADYSGLPERTAKRYIARGRDAAAVAEDNAAPIPEEELPYVAFARRVASARARAKAKNITTISQAAFLRPVRNRDGSQAYDEQGNALMEAGDWRAASWLLERMYPDEFGPKNRTELSGPGGGPIETYSQIDAQVRFDHAAHPKRIAAIATALQDAGLLPGDDIVDAEVVEEHDPARFAWWDSDPGDIE